MRELRAGEMLYVQHRDDAGDWRVSDEEADAIIDRLSGDVRRDVEAAIEAAREVFDRYFPDAEKAGVCFDRLGVVMDVLWHAGDSRR